MFIEQIKFVDDVAKEKVKNEYERVKEENHERFCNLLCPYANYCQGIKYVSYCMEQEKADLVVENATQMFIFETYHNLMIEKPNE